MDAADHLPPLSGLLQGVASWTAEKRCFLNWFFKSLLSKPSLHADNLQILPLDGFVQPQSSDFPSWQLGWHAVFK